MVCTTVTLLSNLVFISLFFSQYFATAPFDIRDCCTPAVLSARDRYAGDHASRRSLRVSSSLGLNCARHASSAGPCVLLDTDVWSSEATLLFKKFSVMLSKSLAFEV